MKTAMYASDSKIVTSGCVHQGLVCQISNAIDEVDCVAWYQVCGRSDWGMNLEGLQVQQQSLAGQAIFWFLIVRDHHGMPVACAALAFFRRDIITSSGRLAKIADRIRGRFPRFLKFGVLFCGPPASCGGNHLHIADGVDAGAVLHCLDEAMQKFAGPLHARLLVFKEFDQASAEQLDAIKRYGYLKAASYPMYHLHRCFGGLDAYRDALRSGYRRQLDASLKKFKTWRLNVTHHTSPEAIAQNYTDQVHNLYLQLWARQPERLEVFTASFFRDLPAAIPCDVILSIIDRDGTPVAFSYGVLSQGCFHNLYVGVDYSLNDTCDLYFNIFFHSIDIAFKRGARQISLGQTSGHFKTRLGAVAQQLHFFVRANDRFSQFALRLFAKMIFPKDGGVDPRNVFKADDGKCTVLKP